MRVEGFKKEGERKEEKDAFLQCDSKEVGVRELVTQGPKLSVIYNRVVKETGSETFSLVAASPAASRRRLSRPVIGRTVMG